MLSLFALGFLIGLQHAFEADHIAAVSALVSNQTSRLRMMRHGALWGLGHTLVLLLVAGGAMLTGVHLGDTFGASVEALVGLMLLGLGLHVLWRLWRDRVHFHWHRHEDGQVHLHLHSHAHDQSHRHRHPDPVAGRALLVGMMHGLAGSAALLLVTVASMDSPLLGLTYIALFGLGSILGMAGMSLVIALPLAATAQRLTRVNGALQAAIGVMTVGIGVWTLLAAGQALAG